VKSLLRNLRTKIESDLDEISMKFFKSISAIARGGVHVVNMTGISYGRRIWRALNGARLVGFVGAAGNKVRLGANVNVLNPDFIKCGSGVSIGDHAELLAEPLDGCAGTSIEIGNYVKIGKRCQLAANPGLIRIGCHASLHSNVVLLGHISIGRYTLLSANIFISSGNHRAFDAPHLLIKDQDLEVSNSGRGVKPVVIEEDCWIGWSAAIMEGVHIGRGAVIGANALVTADVEPYDVVAGQPARRVRKRLEFSPNVQIVAANEECGPYFYRGFLQSRTERQVIAAQWPGHLAALNHAVIVLSGEQRFSRLQLRGVTLADNISLRILFSGGEYVMDLPSKAGNVFDKEVKLSEFQSVSAGIEEHDCRVPESRVFSLTVKYSCADLEARETALPVVWAIHSASLKC
jgi:acetyltransferase-like isoleucine patch superfamily enzyme